MKRKIFVIVFSVLFMLAGLQVFAQYNGFDLERRTPPSLYPQRGPGDAAIVQELRESNRLLLQQNELLREQNRLLKDLLTTKNRK